MEKKKSLGQHFLHSAHYLDLIAETAKIEAGEWVLEIGPGEGTLTRALLSRGAHVLAVEKDHRLIPVLKQTFAKEIAAEQLVLVEADILEFDVTEFVDKKSPYKLVANIPYYISGAILKKFLEEPHQPSSMVLLVQKEVAERIAREKKESILSLSVKVYGEPKYIKTVPAGAFVPPPKVDSAILLVENISRKHFTDVAQEKKFFEIVRAGFGQKRKLLKSNLQPVLGEDTSTILEKTGIAEKARAEEVPLSMWLALCE